MTNSKEKKMKKGERGEGGAYNDSDYTGITAY